MEVLSDYGEMVILTNTYLKLPENVYEIYGEYDFLIDGIDL